MTKVLIFATVIYLSALNNFSLAQGNAEKLFVGKWVAGPNRENTLNIDGNPYRISLRIEDFDGILVTRMESPDADVFNITSAETIVDGYKIKIYFKEIDSLYRGELSAEKMELNGTFVMGNKYISISFKKIRVGN
jgi:predicted transcriptional regulator of viral defense system